MRKKVCVIGGGISGLSASYYLLKKGYDVTLFEASPQLGGLASTFDFGGIIIEKFYHFICGGDAKLIEFAAELGLRDKVKFSPTKTTSFYNGRFFSFSSPVDLLQFSPIPFLSRIRVGFHTAYSKTQKKWEHLDNISAKKWLIQFIGKKAYEAIWHPLLKEKFGEYYEEISAAWIWHRIHRVASSRKSIFSKEKMGYFEGGSHTLIEAIAQNIREMGGAIHVNRPVERIERNNSSLSVHFGSEEQQDFDFSVLAVPLPVSAELVKSMDGEISKKLASIKFFGVVCGIFRLHKNISDAFWLNINDSRIPANGLIEYTNLNPLEHIKPDKIVYIPFYLSVSDERYNASESTLKEEFTKMLKLIRPDFSSNFCADSRIFRSPYAQAICTSGFKERMPPVKTSIDNVFMLDSTQIYPSDRSLNGMIELAENMVKKYF